MLLMQGMKLAGRIENGLADLDEGRPDSHGSPVSKSAGRDASAIPLADFFRGEKFAVTHEGLRAWSPLTAWRGIGCRYGAARARSRTGALEAGKGTEGIKPLQHRSPRL